MTVMNKDETISYIKTFFGTILVTFFVVMTFLGIIQYQVYHDKPQQADSDFEDIYLVGIMIDKNKYLERQHPDDYMINLKLGTLYELQKKYLEAETEYKTAITKSPYAEYKPKYKLALLYTSQGRLEEAEEIMDATREEPDKKLIKYKAQIYSKIGDKYYEKSDYENAADKYEEALFYYNIIKSKESSLMTGNMASAYVYLAEQKIKEMRINDAISYLKTADETIDAPIIKYKLALLLTKTAPDEAFTYFEKVFKTAPELINHDEYKNFLSYLSAEATKEGDLGKAALYEYKARKVDDYFNQNILSVDDISVGEAEGRIKLNKWTKKYNVGFKVTFKNTSREDINSLFLDVLFKDGLKTIDEYHEQIVTDESKLYAGNESPFIIIKTSFKKTKADVHPKKINVEVYVSKTDKSCKLLLKTITIEEQIKPRKINKFIRAFAVLFESIVSKLPSFLF